MKPIIAFIIFALTAADLFSQNDSVLKFIFVPHSRSEDQVHQSVYQEIAKIDFAKYDVRMLGGDITYSTSKDSATLAYCDNLFDLGNPNTLWSFSNHDVQSRNRALIKKFTGRESYYSYNRNGVTFIVLDTELDANSFSRTFIKGDQFQMVKTVCDTITSSNVLILLHHRFMWMINNDYFKPKLTDSIAASSRSMDTTNFYSDIFPLLQKVKNRGIKVLVFGGDKAKINIDYSPEEGITFYAARLAVDLPDSINNVIVLTYTPQNGEINADFVPLSKMITAVEQEYPQLPERFVLYQNYPNPFNPTTTIKYKITSAGFVSLKIYDLLGREVAVLVNEFKNAGSYKINFNGRRTTDNRQLSSGVYFYQLQTDKFVETKKLILLR